MWQNISSWTDIIKWIPIFMPSFEEGRAYCFAAVCQLVCRSISSFRSFCSYWLHILKGNLVYRFIIRISRSISILGMIEHFWQSFGPWTLIIFNNLQFSFIFFSVLCILKWNLVHRFITRVSRWSSVLGMFEPFLTELWALDLGKFQ
jgi:hypothetical protein